MIVLKIQSAGDLITNSSSELFQLKSDLAFDIVKELIEVEGRRNKEAAPDNWNNLSIEERYKFDFSSGNGGEINVYNWEHMFSQYAEYNIVKSKRHLFTPEMWALTYKESLEELQSMIWVDIDWGRHATIKYILDNFWVIDVDGFGFYWQINPETKEKIRVVSKEVYNTLPENCRESDEEF